MRLRSTFITALGVVVLAAVAQPFMQQDDAAVKLRSDTRVVEIDVSVRDSKGRPVEDLKASDFTVTDNGKSRSFTIFSAPHSQPESGSPSESQKDLPQRPALPPSVFTNVGATALPPEGHSTIILLDGENGWLENFANASKGVLGLMAKLPTDEKIALYVILRGTGLGVLQDYTLDRSKVEAALAKFVPRGMLPAPPPPMGFSLDSTKVSTQAGGGGMSSLSVTADKDPVEYKAIALRQAAENVRLSLNALAEKLRSVPGRKSMFWISQGLPPVTFPEGQKTPAPLINTPSWDKTIASLNDANIAVNTVDSDGLGGPVPFWLPGGSLTLQKIADETGGQAYSNRNDLDAAMASGIADSRSSYTLGFYLTELDGQFHQLKVNVNRPNLQLNYRQGYYAQTDTIKDASGSRSPLQAALLNPSGSADVRMTARLDIAPGEPRRTLNTRLTLESEPLSMKPTDSGFTGKVEELFLELDAAGREVGRYSDAKEFTVSAANKDKFDTQGVTLAQAIPLETNAVSVSIVVRDAASGRTGSLVIPLEKVTRQEPAH